MMLLVIAVSSVNCVFFKIPHTEKKICVFVKFAKWKIKIVKIESKNA